LKSVFHMSLMPEVNVSNAQSLVSKLCTGDLCMFPAGQTLNRFTNASLQIRSFEMSAVGYLKEKRHSNASIPTLCLDDLEGKPRIVTILQLHIDLLVLDDHFML